MKFRDINDFMEGGFMDVLKNLPTIGPIFECSSYV
jgi:hypothetical protein